MRNCPKARHLPQHGGCFCLSIFNKWLPCRATKQPQMTVILRGTQTRWTRWLPHLSRSQTGWPRKLSRCCTAGSCNRWWFAEVLSQLKCGRRRQGSAWFEMVSAHLVREVKVAFVLRVIWFLEDEMSKVRARKSTKREVNDSRGAYRRASNHRAWNSGAGGSYRWCFLHFRVYCLNQFTFYLLTFGEFSN